MAVQLHHSDCDRMREFVSLRLDGELSRIEERRLESHLARCSDCHTYAAGVSRAAELLRESSAEEPALTFSLPNRRWRVVQSAQVAVAAVAAVIVAAIGLPQLLSTAGQRQSGSSSSFVAADTRPAYLQSPEYEVKMAQRATANRTRPHVRLSQ